MELLAMDRVSDLAHLYSQMLVSDAKHS